MLFASIYVPDFPVQAALRSEAGDSHGEKLSRESVPPKLSYLKDQIAVLDGPANQMKVIACNEPARRAGIETGMTKLQAEALPSVTLRKRVLDHEYIAQAVLLECAGKLSPRLESTCPGMVIVDLTGAERLSGTRKKIAEKLGEGAEEYGLSVNVALASNADTAMLAALGIKGVTVVKGGEEAHSLGDLPVSVVFETARLRSANLQSANRQFANPQFANLQFTNLQSANLQFANHQFANPQITNHAIANHQSAGFHSKSLRSGKLITQLDIAGIMDALTSWGIRDFKSLAALPSVPLTQRLGQYGLHLQRLAKGEVQRELVPYVEASSFQASMELEESIALLEPLGFVLDCLLEQVVVQLINRSLATDRIQVDLELEIHSDCQLQLARQQSAPLEPKYQKVLKLPVPTQDAKIILKLLELDLAGKPPHAPVKKVSVEAFPARVKFGQTGLFQPVAPEPAKLEVTLARLRSVVGDKDDQGRALVGFPVILDSNRPDSFDVARTMPSSKTKKIRPAENKSIVPRHAMRVLRPPAEVKVGLVKDGLRGRVPATISFAEIRGKVMEVSGPWRTSGSWWDQNQAWNREEWDVEVRWDGVRRNEGHAIFRVFREVASDRWFVEGIYA
jgi:nucleotidyltransferase/DNA polymerase involved in DNA repair